FPDTRIVGKRGEGRFDSGPVLRDVLAVQTEPLFADADGSLRVHHLESAFGPVWVLAQFAIKVVEDGQNELGRCRNLVGNIDTSGNVGITLFDRQGRRLMNWRGTYHAHSIAVLEVIGHGSVY